tara:strand:- start:713 stop:1027 length:315 start_codon:yes stop_codon:yes gene_type:complete
MSTVEIYRENDDEITSNNSDYGVIFDYLAFKTILENPNTSSLKYTYKLDGNVLDINTSTIQSYEILKIIDNDTNIDLLEETNREWPLKDGIAWNKRIIMNYTKI